MEESLEVHTYMVVSALWRGHEICKFAYDDDELTLIRDLAKRCQAMEIFMLIFHCAQKHVASMITCSYFHIRSCSQVHDAYI